MTKAHLLKRLLPLWCALWLMAAAVPSQNKPGRSPSI